MKRKFFILSIFLCCSIFSTFLAQAEVLHPKGTLELRTESFTGAGATFINPHEGTSLVFGKNALQFNLGLKGGVGYFVLPNLSVGGLVGINIAHFGGTIFSLPIGGFVRWMMLIIPYVDFFVEGNVGLVVCGGGGGNTFVGGDLGARAGIDWLFTNRAAFFAGLFFDVIVGRDVYFPIGLLYGLRGYI